MKTGLLRLLKIDRSETGGVNNSSSETWGRGFRGDYGTWTDLFWARLTINIGDGVLWQVVYHLLYLTLSFVLYVDFVFKIEITGQDFTSARCYLLLHNILYWIEFIQSCISIQILTWILGKYQNLNFLLNLVICS